MSDDKKRSVGFAPSWSSKPSESDGARRIEIGGVVSEPDEVEAVALVVLKSAASIREAGAIGVTLSDGAAVAADAIFGKLGLHRFNQEEFDALVRIFRGFEVAAIKCALRRGQSN